MAISPFAKPHYVSHHIGDHTSLLAFIERVFLANDGVPAALTNRDRYADPLEDLFDFDGAPSADSPVGTAAPPTNDCTPAH
jgi:phospholipase C